MDKLLPVACLLTIFFVSPLYSQDSTLSHSDKTISLQLNALPAGNVVFLFDLPISPYLSFYGRMGGRIYQTPLGSNNRHQFSRGLLSGFGLKLYGNKPKPLRFTCVHEIRFNYLAYPQDWYQDQETLIGGSSYYTSSYLRGNMQTLTFIIRPGFEYKSKKLVFNTGLGPGLRYKFIHDRNIQLRKSGSRILPVHIEPERNMKSVIYMIDMVISLGIPI